MLEGYSQTVTHTESSVHLSHLAMCEPGGTFMQVQAASEEAYTAVVCQHVQEHLATHTNRVFDSPVLPAAQAYVAAVPLEFLRLLLSQVITLPITSAVLPCGACWQAKPHFSFMNGQEYTCLEESTMV